MVLPERKLPTSLSVAQNRVGEPGPPPPPSPHPSGKKKLPPRAGQWGQGSVRVLMKESCEWLFSQSPDDVWVRTDEWHGDLGLDFTFGVVRFKKKIILAVWVDVKWDVSHCHFNLHFLGIFWSLDLFWCDDWPLYGPLWFLFIRCSFPDCFWTNKMFWVFFFLSF